MRHSISSLVYGVVFTILATLSPEIRLETFTVGYITGSQRRSGDLEYAKPGLTISGGISLAIEEINKSGDLAKRGHQLDLMVAETYGEEITSVQKTADLWKENVAAYIGPQETCVHEAFMAAAFNLPMISYFCTHYATSDKTRFPTFARTRPPDTKITKSLAAVLVAFQWNHVAVFYLKSPEFQFAHIANVIHEMLDSLGIVVAVTRYWSTPYHHGYSDNPFYKLVQEVYTRARIFVILGHHYEHLGLMIAMQEMGLFAKGEYFVIGVDLEAYDEKAPEKYMKGLLRDEADPIAEQAFRSYLGIVPSSPVGFQNFTSLVNSYMERPPFNYPNPLTYFGFGKQIRTEAAFLYDAVHLYGRALLEVLDADGDPRNGTAIINRLKGTHYKSAMGYMVYMDENGDAEGNYTLIARKQHEHTKQYGLYPVGGFTLWKTKSRLPVLHITDKIEWIQGHPPMAAPLCGFHGEKCITNTIEITSGVTGALFFLVSIIFLILYRNWKYEQELDSLLWKVDFREVRMVNDNTATTDNSVPPKVNKIVQPLIRTSQVSLSSNPDADHRYSAVFTNVGIYRGRLLAIKKVYKKSIDITREMKKELKMMRDLRHDNLNAFIGACTDPPNICILTEYCARGSLRDILENGDVKLDSMFIASLVGDILRGMIYLHDSPIRYHGALSATNCLVDSRWVVKLADFGLTEFKRGAEYPPIKDQSDLRERCLNLLYKAPEVLRIEEPFISPNHSCGSPKGDVYSFGILLYEIHGRSGPFGNLDTSYVEILNRVIRPTLTSPLRPPLDALENTFDFVKECLKECWVENPDDRPDFKTIRTKLRPLRKGMKPNIFDNMMAMMQKYANNLEVLVDERTDQLQEEKKKTEALLYEMLPRPVAEQLKKGHKVEAESFDCVTIFFSDIVGFTSMSAQSTPLEVVDFLNDLYTCFDSILGNYDVYKVETIGDAYMVVSGLPIRNGFHHAAEIASMSLHLLEQVRNFTIRHLPHEKLKLRIGIHSGPVCAGVVGLKMPRYCLFGDTVNTASRMESTGAPLKVHCSSQCKDLLLKIGGYLILDRGIVTMKGKGDQKTYWLTGEDPCFRKIRQMEREKRRKGTSGTAGRSSLKTRGNLTTIARCSSFETPKKLRFASSDKLHTSTTTPKFVAVITDGSPRHSKSILMYQSTGGAASCPCIENLTHSSVVSLAQCQAAVLGAAWTPGVITCRSVPILHTTTNTGNQLAVPSILASGHGHHHPWSAPVSPRKSDLLIPLDNQNIQRTDEIPANTKCWIMGPGDSTPLLKVTPDESLEKFETALQ